MGNNTDLTNQLGLDQIRPGVKDNFDSPQGDLIVVGRLW